MTKVTDFWWRNSDVSRNQKMCHVIYTFFGSSIGKVNCAKFHHYRICVTCMILCSGVFLPLPPAWAALKRFILNRLNNDLCDFIYNKDFVVEKEILKVKFDEADKEKTFLRGEFKYLTVLLNEKIQIFSHNFKTYTKESLLQGNLDTQVQLPSSFQTSSPKCNMLKNRNNFSNKSNS